MTSPIDSAAWQQLQEHAQRFQRDDFRLDSLFADDPRRFQHYSGQAGELLADYSKHFIDSASQASLLQLAQDQDLPAAIAAMFAGAEINNTEQRAALHVALREPANNRFPEVAETLNKMQQFVQAVHNKSWTGYTDKAITDVVNIGIGGSDLGPAMVSEALAAFHVPGLTVHFVSNVDPNHLHSVLARLDPATTLFVIASKSFTTLETHQNAAAARRWFLQSAGEASHVARHFVAISTNLDAAADFGIDPGNLFPMWDWVGGRYSLWSAIGLPIALAIGFDNFRELLAGAHSMDQHFRDTDLRDNLPVQLGLLTVFYTAFFNAHSTAVVPYCQPLAQFPSYLQQLYMESLGKRVQKDGSAVQTNTGEILWGTAGTNGQHSYFQLLHQGCEFTPVDFIAFAQSGVADSAEQHRHLLANCLSQSLALMSGKPGEDNPHKQVPGNRPSTTFIMPALTPSNLGSLIALYEHKVYVQSVIWDINAFDQWGVELGKILSKSMFAGFGNAESRAQLDPSSAGLLNQLMAWEEQI